MQKNKLSTHISSIVSQERDFREGKKEEKKSTAFIAASTASNQTQLSRKDSQSGAQSGSSSECDKAAKLALSAAAVVVAARG